MRTDGLKLKARSHHMVIIPQFTIIFKQAIKNVVFLANVKSNL